MFETIDLQNLANFGYREGHHFKFQNSAERKSLKLRNEVGPTCQSKQPLKPITPGYRSRARDTASRSLCLHATVVRAAPRRPPQAPPEHGPPPQTIGHCSELTASHPMPPLPPTSASTRTGTSSHGAAPPTRPRAPYCPGEPHRLQSPPPLRLLTAQRHGAPPSVKPPHATVAADKRLHADRHLRPRSRPTDPSSSTVPPRRTSPATPAPISAAPTAPHRSTPWSASLGETPTSPTPKSVMPPRGESPHHLPHRPRASGSPDVAGGVGSRDGQGKLPCSLVWATSPS
jgi:hypothetical protein